MTELKIGDAVYLITDRHGCGLANPVKGSKYECQGKIDGTHTGIDNFEWIGVQWSNGLHNTYAESDLELVKEAPILKYEIAKDFTPNDFYRAALEDHGLDWKCTEFDTDIMWFESYAGGMYKKISITPAHGAFFEYVERHNYFKRDLLKYGFIKEKEPEVFYKVGDKFKITEGAFRNQIYRIIHSGCIIFLKKEDEDVLWTSKGIAVNKLQKITKEELNEAFSSAKNKFIKIA